MSETATGPRVGDIVQQSGREGWVRTALETVLAFLATYGVLSAVVWLTGDGPAEVAKLLISTAVGGARFLWLLTIGRKR